MTTPYTSYPHDADNIPLTIGLLLKRMTVAISCTVALIGGTLWLAGLRTEISSLKQQATYQEARLVQTESHGIMTDKSISDLKQKLDKAVTILERLDRKLGQP